MRHVHRGVIGVGLVTAITLAAGTANGSPVAGAAPAAAAPIAPGSAPVTSGTVAGIATAPARPSSACAAPQAPQGMVAVTAGTVRGGYLVSLPQDRPATDPAPVVVDLHGYGVSANVETTFSGLSQAAGAAGFVTLTPQIDRPVPRWDLAAHGDDERFIVQVLDTAAARWCLDLNRVYLAGMSNGAIFTSRLACDAAATFAAVATVAGLRDPTDCAPARAMPIIAFHGTDDQFLTYDGHIGPGALTLPSTDGNGTLREQRTSSSLAVDVPSVGERYGPGIPQTAAIWAQRAGCRADPTGNQVAADVVLFDYDCPSGTDVQLYRVDHGGHAWPGSPFSAVVGRTTMSISADDLMLAFFARFALTGAATA